MAGNGVNIPKFGDWKTTDGGSPYTMYFENARKRRNNTGITPPPVASPCRMDSAPSGHRTPPRAADAKPVKPQHRANRSKGEGKSGQSVGTIPEWGRWNQSNTGAGDQQYTLVFNQLREERRSAPSTPSVDQLQWPNHAQANERDLYDHNKPKGFKCCGLF